MIAYQQGWDIIRNNIILMEDLAPHLIPRKKKTNDGHPVYKSPYFSSVRRNSTNSKQRISAQHAITITKYPELTGEHKKKVFKRFNKFQQIDELYLVPDVKIKKNNSERENHEPKYEDRHREIRASSNSKNIIYSNKTIALADKYSSYKSIIMSTPKMLKESKQKIRRNSNFRTKVKSGNTIHWNSQSKEADHGELDLSKDHPTHKQLTLQNQDWLCRELIQNQVYGLDDDDCF